MITMLINFVEVILSSILIIAGAFLTIFIGCALLNLIISIVLSIIGFIGSIILVIILILGYGIMEIKDWIVEKFNIAKDWFKYRKSSK